VETVGLIQVGDPRTAIVYFGGGHAPTRSFGLAGASVFRGPEGYGASSRIYSTRILRLSEGLPRAGVIVADRRVRPAG
jgi:hypothetical protein